MKTSIYIGLLCYLLFRSIFFPFLAYANEAPKKLSLVSLKNDEIITYEQLLRKNRLTGLSLAVVDNYNLIYTRSAGFKENTTAHKIDANTAFSTASISKPITATITAMLAERGLLNLDDAVDPYLKRWHIPKSPFTKDRAITFRDLLSHTAGTSQSGFADFYLGDEIPSAIESLNGIKLPRYSKPISVEFKPGSYWNYSGGGYVIVQIALEDITGKPLAKLAEDMIFSPLGMANTTMYQHGHPKFLKNVAKVHDDDQQVIKTGIPICPQVAPSGMWSSARDMAKFIIDYQLALANKPSKVISPWVANELTKVHTLQRVGGWSAGWMRFQADGNLDWFSHGGSNTGTGGQIMATMTEGRAIIIFGNGGNPSRISSIDSLVASVISQLDWNKNIQQYKKAPNDKHIKRILGRYLSEYNTILTVDKKNEELVYSGYLSAWGSAPDGKLIYSGDNVFSVDSFANQISVEREPKSQRDYLVYTRKGTELKYYAMQKLGKNEKVPFEVVGEENFEESVKAYRIWQKKYPDSPVFSEQEITNFGRRSLSKKNYKIALNFFRVLTTLYPKNANNFNYLAEIYMKIGDKKNAKKFYHISYSLDTSNENTKKMLEKLR
ncbi:serine hydrolase domain-containing protein [Agarilytica rhodophyticola]|uniref:serine hydrolase domain-containing protein n=1 Tax=Agarilytica rhodophyticola TaxID=1737490 RepID=UPI001319D593|nr:serine hydrolase domain-containing protein [Agarilytica rhodophyticola]